MLRNSRLGKSMAVTGHIGPAGLLTIATMILGGCSADVGRFDFASVGPGNQPRSSTALTPTPSEPLRRNNAGIPVSNEDLGPVERRPQPYGSARAPTPAEPTVRMSGLPEPVSREPQPRNTPPLQPAPQPRSSAPQPLPTVAAPGRQSPTAAGEQIEVQTGDTLYGISKKYRVPISELMTLNGLKTPAIKPGQKLVLPAASGGRRPIAQRPAPAVEAAAPARAETVSTIAPAAPSNWTGSHTLAPGESLYGIARKYKVKTADLQAANNITDATKMRPGTVLKVPGDGAALAPVAATAPVERSAPVAAAPQPAQAAPASGPRPTIINAQQQPAAETRVAALGAGTQPTQSDVSQSEKPEPASTTENLPKASTAGKFRWPAKGKVIANFGPRADSTHNDGINISVPKGTDVLAAENGVVAYAGNELKGYGNLVLVRHDGNWVSAYAHNDAVLVKRGDKVRRGQSIAKAGNTGSVDQPQVHFELRQGSKPVDPLPHMEKN